MKAKVIGIGAAGNKAAISLVENGILGNDEIVLINSTLKDIPIEYRSLAIQFSDSSGGCGKERNIAKKLCYNSFNNDTLSRLDSLMDPNDKLCIIVNSSEGGTGCGSSPTIAKYMNEVIDCNVHMFVFTGFEEDGRGLQNTVEYFQELNKDYVVEAISNKKFLNQGNKLRAEKLANLEFCERVKVLLGLKIIDSEQNIDETDLYKVATTAGFMNIEHYELEEKIKNVAMFNSILTDIMDNSKSLEHSDMSAKRIAVILNISEKSKEFIDYSFSGLKDRYGVPYEIFTHIQNDESKEYIDFIVSGMNLPIDEVKSIYDKYKIASEKVNKSEDEFLNVTRTLKGNEEDSMFDMSVNNKNTKNKTLETNKKEFLKDFGNKWENQMGDKSISNDKPNNTKKSKQEFLKDQY